MVGSFSTGLGLGRAGGASANGAWLDADFSAGKFRFGGRSLADEAAFHAAIGGTAPASGHLIIGPYVSLAAPELLTDGDFAMGSAGDWTSVGSTIAVAAGALRVTGGGGNGSGAYRSIADIVESAGRAYRLTAKVWRDTASNVALGFGANGGGTANYAQTANLTGTAPSAVTLYCGGFGSGTASIALRHLVNPSSGTYFADDLSLREALPYRGFRPGALSGVIKATTPASGGTGGIIFQADDNAEFNGNWFERNYIRLVWDASKHLRLIVSFGGSGAQVEQANLDLGAVSAGTSFEVGFSARDGLFVAMLGGQGVQHANSGTFPGIATVRLGRGRSTVTSLWTGSIERLQLFSGALTEEELVAAMAGGGAVAWGDSLTAGAGATGGSTGRHTYPVVAQGLFSPERLVVGQGMGGQTSTQIAARMNAVPIAVTISGNAIPASGAVEVTQKSVNVLVSSGVFTGMQRGTLAGIEGVMSTDASGNWSFTRSRAGLAVPVPAGSQFHCAWGEHLRGLTAWLWLGRNGAQAGRTVIEDIAASVASLGHARYLIGAVLPSSADNAGALASLVSLNGLLASTYGDRFIDLVLMLQGEADGSAEDATDVAAGFIPRSLRSDHLHLNDAGYAFVAEAFVAAHMAMGW